ncbi:hypothetical protein EBU71_20765, partial [bacterium]|nr:hypothetical protein [Candidatus Elulimicrobium humile]
LSPTSTQNHSFTTDLRADENFYVSWTTLDTKIQFTYDCQVAGWVGIGFDKSSTIHRSTDTYLSWVLSSGQGVVLNGYSDTRSQPITDDIQIATVTYASVIQNRLQLTFERPLFSNQSTDYSFIPDEWILMGWAYHPTANPNILPNDTSITSIQLVTHTARGAVYKNIYTGETQAHKQPLTPSTYYLLLMCAGFIGFATFQRLKCTIPLKWLKEKNKYFTKHSNVECLSIIGILILNGLCITLGIQDHFTNAQVWGLMSTANSLIVAIPATRNSVLTWLSGIPVDQTLMYHRWLGRITIIEAIVHFGYSIRLPEQFVGQSLYGILALACAWSIGITSIQWLRRNAFNFFFTMHHVFILYYVLGSLHSPVFFNLTLAGIGLYILDLFIRMSRGLFPRKIIYAEQIHSRLFKIQFPKPPFCST